MPLSPAKRKSNDKWIKENYKQVKLSMPNEEAELLEKHCVTYNYSKAGFIRQAIQEKISLDVSATDTSKKDLLDTPSAPNQFILPLTPEELEQLDRHCLFSLCKKPDFIYEAIKEKLLRESPLPVPTKKESSPEKGKPNMIVRQTDDDDLTEDLPTLLKTIRGSQKTSSKSTLTQMVAGQIITDKMNNLRSENRTEEYIALTNLFVTTPKNKAEFMEEVKNASFMSDVDEAVAALVIFHGLKDGE